MGSSVDTLVAILPAWRRSLRADNRRETTIAYLRLRAAHRDADGPWLWLGYRPPKLSDSGIAQLVAKRGRDLGFRLHPHVFGHSFAHNFMAAGGQETDLMRLAGWSSTQIVQRYGASAGMERAHASARRITIEDRW